MKIRPEGEMMICNSFVCLVVVVCLHEAIDIISCFCHFLFLFFCVLNIV